jgi:predicted DNA binding CopG/RHH family protein
MTHPKKQAQAATTSRIPQFSSREEEAAWWDSHDITDYLAELKPIRVRFAKNLSEGLTVRLDPQTMHELRERAKRQGIGPTTLIRMWVMERLRAEAGQPTP